MQTLLDFLSLADHNTRNVVLGVIMLSISSAVVGSFTFLKKSALVGDAVAHAILPGLCAAFIFTGERNPLVLIVGSFATGWLSILAVDWITAHSRLKKDTAISMVLSTFFGLGILLLTYIQHRSYGNQAGLDQFIFGQAASMSQQDLVVFSALGALITLMVLLFYKELRLVVFDPHFARAIGFPVRKAEMLLTTLTVLAIVAGIQAVGVVLMAAMLITPVAAARYWTDRLSVMILLAAVLAAFSGLAGTYISYVAPAMPTGPWVVIVVSGLAFISFFVSPKRGILGRMFRKRIVRRRILLENILKQLYQAEERHPDQEHYFSPQEIAEVRHIPRGALLRGLSTLLRQGFLQYKRGRFRLNQAGTQQGRRLLRLHRLWELYLTEYLHIAADHVHDDADTIEHILTPELERQLDEHLGQPTEDPHQSPIPPR